MREEGIALVIAMMATTLLSALVAALALTTTMETQIAAGFVGARQAFYAADAAAEWATAELSGLADWTAVANGTARLGFVDGAVGRRALPDGSVVDLGAMAAADAAWHLAAYGRLKDLVLPSLTRSPFYIVIFVA